MPIGFNMMCPDDKILYAKTKLVSDHPFYACIMYHMKFICVTDNTVLPTMGVNKYGTLYWSYDFVKNISDLDHLVAVIVHEILHIALLTFIRCTDKHESLWNIASDIAINYIIVRSDMVLPDNIIGPSGEPLKFYIPSINGSFETRLNDVDISFNVSELSAEDIYNKILNEIKHTDTWQNGTGDGSDINSDCDTVDTHLNSDKDPNGSSDGLSGNISDEFNEKKWKRVLSQAIDAGKSAGSKYHGVLERFIDELLNPKLNWKVLLYNYIVKDLPFDYTMSRPSKRSYSNGVYTPSVMRENLELVIAVDVSGSISQDEYQLFISEIMGICNVSDNIRARLIFWDTEVDMDSVYTIGRHNRDEILRIHPNGGGGTTISCVKKYVEEESINSRLFIYLTDGEVWECNENTLPEGTNICVITPSGDDSMLKDYAITVTLEE